MYSLAVLVLCLAVLLPLPLYFAYCHLNKKEIDRNLIQLVGFSAIIPGITLLTWDEFMDAGAACVIFGAILGFVFARFAEKK